jgi:hypothetical protein
MIEIERPQPVNPLKLTSSIPQELKLALIAQPF